MQKKIIALAIAGLASSAVFADTNVTIYGSVDYGYMTRSGNDGMVTGAKDKREFTSGGSATNRIGFKGVEDLGNGLKALFEVEFGMQGDQNDKPGFNSNRHAYVGLTGKLGTVVGGRLDGVRYGVFNTYDPFAGGSVGNFTQMTTQYDRADNAIAYISPKWSGFGLVLAHSQNTGGAEGSSSDNTDLGAPAGTAGAKVGNKGDDVLYTIMGTYDNGPVSVRLDYETTHQAKIDGGRLYVATAGASYDFGVVKLGAVYDVIKGQNNSNIGSYDRRNWFVAASAPLGKFTLMANYGQVSDREKDDADASKWAVGARYALSKRTYAYTAYTKISNDDAAAYSVSQSAASNGVGYGVRGFELGLRHTF